MATLKLCLFAGLSLAYAAVAQGTDAKQGSGGQPMLARTGKGDWSLQARQADLAKLIAEIAAKTGTRVHYTVLPETPVDATCIGSSATELLQCLLGSGANLVFRQADNGQGGELWIMGSSLAQAGVAKSGCATLVAAAPASIEPAKPDMTEQWLRQAGAKDPAVRAQAVAELGGADLAFDGKVKAALQKALSDKDARVRVQAIGAWISREGEAAAGEQLRRALNDGNAEVRLMALDNIEQDAGLLQQAARDSDKTVRELAEMKLEQLAKP